MARGANASGGWGAPLTANESSLRRIAELLTDNAYSSPITAGGLGGIAQLGGNLAQVAVAKVNADRADAERNRYVNELTSSLGRDVPERYQGLVKALANDGNYGGLYTVAADAEDRRKRDDSRAWVDSIFSGGGANQPQTQSAGLSASSDTAGMESSYPGANSQSASGYRARLAGYESGGDPMAKNPNSTATGRYQPIASTWADMGMGDASRDDPQAQEQFLDKFLDSNASAMQPWLGRDPNDSEQYAAHRLGAEGARRLYTSRPDATIESIIGPEAARVNPDIAGKSAGQVRSMFEQRMGSQATWKPQQQQQQSDFDGIVTALTGSGGSNAIAGGGGQPGQFAGGGATSGVSGPQDWQSIAQNLSPIEQQLIRTADDPQAEFLKVVQGKLDQQSKDARDYQNRGASVVNLLLPDGKTVRAFDANRDQYTISNLLKAGARQVDNDFQPGGQGGPFPGKSVEAGGLNIIYDYQGKRDRGEATTPDEDRAYALAIARTSQVISDPATGEQYVFSPITKQAIRLDDQGNPVGQPFAMGGGADGEQAGAPSGTFDERSTVLEAAGEGTGFVSGLARWYQGSVGQIPGSPQADETVAASNAIRIINQNLKQALVNNPRFPVAEQEIVSRMLPDPESLFANPADQQNKLRQLHEYIKTKMAQNNRALGARISIDRRRELMDQNADMESVVNMLQSMPIMGQAGNGDQSERLKYGADGERVR